MHGTKFREYVAENEGWFVTQRGGTASAWQRGWPANASDMEPITLPWKPEDLQTQNLSAIREYFLCFGQRWASLPEKNQSLIRARQWAIGLGQSVPTLPNFNGTTNNVPEGRCRGASLGFTVVNAFPRFKSWAQYDSVNCRATDNPTFFRLSIRVTALPNTTLDVKFFEWIDDAYRVVLPDYATSAVPIAAASSEPTTPRPPTPVVPDSTTATIATSTTTRNLTSVASLTATSSTLLAMTVGASTAKDSTGAIVGGTLGAVAVVAILVVVIIAVTKCRKRQRGATATLTALDTYGSLPLKPTASAYLDTSTSTSNYAAFPQQPEPTGVYGAAPSIVEESSSSPAPAAKSQYTPAPRQTDMYSNGDVN